MESFQNYPFCGGCLPNVMLQYAIYQTAVRREQWTRTVAARIGNWKQRAIEAIGISTSVGVAVGGAAAAVTGAAVGMVHGMVKGAIEGSSGSPRLQLGDAGVQEEGFVMATGQETE